MNPKQLLEHIVGEVLEEMGHWSIEAEQLLMGTAAQESNFQYIKQLGGGPALGLWQMEPATHDDIWNNYLAYKKPLARKVYAYLPMHIECDVNNPKDCFKKMRVELMRNPAYACAMARVHYLRVPEALPRDTKGQAKYWKKYYNTIKGKGTPEEYIANYNKYVANLF